MDSSRFSKKRISAKPGVYFFLGKKKEILYIGKATSLKQRVKSYFDKNIREKRSALIEKMVIEAKDIEWVETDSVLEAMLFEVNLIRTHRPTYNTRSKDDKSYNHLVITNEEFPRVLVIRGKDLRDQSALSSFSHVYGPFPSGVLFKEALKIIRKLFKFYDTRNAIDLHASKLERGKIDFNRQIGLYPGSCTKVEYARTIRHICLFFEGKKKKIIAELEKEMHSYARSEQFEKAHEVKKKIFALQHIQDIALIKDDVREYRDQRNIRIEAYDVAHLGGKNMVGAMTVIADDKLDKESYRKFTIRGFTEANDPGALQEILRRRLSHPEWTYPELIVVDGGVAQLHAALHVLKQFNLTVPVVGVVKDEHHKAKQIIGDKNMATTFKKQITQANAEAHRFAITFFRKKQNKSFLEGI